MKGNTDRDMCGIFAILSTDPKLFEINVFERMSKSLIHRGPDDCGYIFFELYDNQKVLETNILNKNIQTQIQNYNGILALGHRRLSIIDLSETGHQPMCNEDRNIWVILNGEIYNYRELTEELKRKGHYFRSKTDTEVIIHAYEEWGIECLSHFNGMWAFALWDTKKNRLFCSRDRFGIKPFYYYFDGHKLILASEIKAILQDSEIERAVNHKRVFDYLIYGYLDHTEETFFQNIKQLRGSHFLTLDIKGNDLIFNIERYWDLKPAEAQKDTPCEKKFLELFEDSIRLHMRSDVPIGTCLSGGLDSSSIVCVAHKYLDKNIHKTFSSCFEDERYDERKYIREVSKITHIEPYYVFPDPLKLFDDLNDLIWYQEEPFGSTSVYAQWNVFRLAKEQGVKVVLDGQGADELLAGYHPCFGYYLSELIRTSNFYNFIKEYKRIRFLYHYSHSWIIGHLLINLLPITWSRFLRNQARYKNNKWLNVNHASMDDNKKKFKNILFNRLYYSLMDFSLPGLLHYEDRNSMAHSIEARVPFLDHRLVEYIFSLSMNYIIQNGSTKYILRKSMKGIIPDIIRTRLDKMGFVTPVDIWIRGVLKDRILEIIDSNSFAERGYLNIKEVKRAFLKHCKRQIDLGLNIWRWVNLELWFRMFIDNR